MTHHQREREGGRERLIEREGEEGEGDTEVSDVQEHHRADRCSSCPTGTPQQSATTSVKQKSTKRELLSLGPTHKP